MKKLIILSFTILFSIIGYAQSTDEVEIIQGVWGQEKREIVAKYMALTPDEEITFWNDYDAYEVSRKELGKERLTILNEYADNYENLSNEKATDLINRSIANNMAIDKLIKKTFKKMSKSIPATQAALFVQLENYFMVVTKMAIQESVFFIGELDDLMLE